jgi:mitochondrial intermediate peptidase
MAWNVLSRPRWITLFRSKHLSVSCIKDFSSQATASTDSDLIECFDRPSRYTSPSFQRSTGLFGDTRLSRPEAFQDVANDALFKARHLVKQIVDAPASREELFKVVSNLDKLSDLLCLVIDLAEFIRTAHPDPAWVEQANAVYESLCEYMNVLNTHTGLDQV